jgi:proline iminopeptidase
MTLYPEIEPFQVHRLSVGDSHVLYIEQCGCRGGIPVVFLHGGPGSGCTPLHRRYFDPSRYNIVLFDQRGAGRSVPQGELRANNTEALVGDLERIRGALGIRRWLLSGGSWGATLGLLYAQHHPGKVLGMILRAPFLGMQRELDWFIKDGANRIYPDYWEDLVAGIPVEEQRDLVEAFYRRLTSGDRSNRLEAAMAWDRWERAVLGLSSGQQSQPINTTEKELILNEVSIRAHFAAHRYFLQSKQILRQMSRLPEVPIILVHGRQDITCPLQSSWALHQRLPHSSLVIVPEAGHLGSDPAMSTALVGASREMLQRLSTD